MKITEAMKAKMREMRSANTLREIADYFGVSVYSVYCATKSIKPVKSSKPKEGWPDIESVREYRRYHSLSETADRFGVSISWVHTRTRDIVQERERISKHPLYGRWIQIKRRCDNPRCHAYGSYGGRGIKLHGPWYDFYTFAADLFLEIGECPKGCSLDRIDNDGDYEPGNLRWATAAEQINNRRDTRKRIKFLGKAMTYDEISELTGLSKGTVRSFRFFPDLLEKKYEELRNKL